MAKKFLRKEGTTTETTADWWSYQHSGLLCPTSYIGFLLYGLANCNKKKPHTTGEELVKLAAANMVRVVCGGDVIRKIEQIPLWSDTIRARIIDTTYDIKLQVTAAIKRNGQFSLQLDESTDVSNDAQWRMFAIEVETIWKRVPVLSAVAPYHKGRIYYLVGVFIHQGRSCFSFMMVHQRC